MALVDRLQLGLRRKLPILIQAEMSECGLACLAMIAGFYGFKTELSSLRHEYPVSQRGAGLSVILRIAVAMGMGTRAVKLGLEELGELKLPCILHWNMNHFVVLSSCDKKNVVIHDPAIGLRRLSWEEASTAFTGVAVECWPSAAFRPRDERKPFRMRRLLGTVRGLNASMGHIFVLALALEIFALLSPLFLQWLVDKVALAADRDLLTMLALGFGGLVVLQQAVSALRSWALVYFGTTLNVQWSSNVFSHMIRLPVQFFEKRHIGDVVSRFNAVHTIQQTLTTAFIEVAVDGVVSLATLVVLFLYSPVLGCMTLGVMLAYGGFRMMWYRPLREATEEQIMQEAKQQSHFLETVRGIKAIKLFGRLDLRRSGWQTHLVNQINAGIRTEKINLAYRSINGLLFGFQNIITLSIGTSMIIDGTLTVGALMAFHAYKSQFDSRMSCLINKAFEWKMMKLQGERLAEILEAVPEPISSCVDEVERSQDGIEVSEVSFKYAGDDAYTLERISFSVSPGTSVALVGASGCGKTTLLNVLMGILKPDSGQVKVGGVLVNEGTLDVVRARIGTVLQDDVLFAGSIGENICFFASDPDREWMCECARLAAIEADILAMPMGYHTLVGDMGSALSGGQKQRILIARALYKRPQFLFLDEATSHLDLRAEQQVNAAIKGMNITRFLIAHRPETIATADRVIEICDGKIVRDFIVAKAFADHKSTNSPT
jgi:ATP-binding cassette subfamily B protein RaxB